MTDEIIAILVDDDGPSGESNSLKPIMQREKAIKRQQCSSIKGRKKEEQRYLPAKKKLKYYKFPVLIIMIIYEYIGMIY